MAESLVIELGCAQEALPPLRRSRVGGTAAGPAPPRNRSDEWLAANVGRVVPEPFEVLFERYWAPLVRYCGSLMGCSEAGADAAQDAMLSAYAHLRRNPRELAFRPWLYTVARNACIDRMRASRLDVCELPDDDHGAPADAQDPLEVRARLRSLVADLQALSERQRAALLLRVVSGLGHRAIAARLGTSSHRAKALVYEARQTLLERRAGRAMSCEQFADEAAPFGRRVPPTHRLGAHLADCLTCRAGYDRRLVAA